MAPNRHSKTKVQLGVRIEVELMDQLKAKADAEGRELAAVVRDALRRYVTG